MHDTPLAVVTGSGRGIGQAIAERLADDGMRLIIADIDDDTARQTAERMTASGRTAHGIGLDVASPESVARAVAETTDRFGPIRVLVNNAGIVSNTPWEDTGLDEWNTVLAINLTGTMLMTHAVLPVMRDAGCGRVINIVSLAGRNGGVSVGPAYAASKAGVIGLTRHYAGKVARDGITVNAVAPGTTATAMASRFTPEQMAAINDSIPVGRLGRVDEIAAAVSYFAGPHAGFTTGAVLDVNGGMHFA
ncbi:3-oxoacyl-ACP reductase FabG [Actinomyces sp. B33]|uniref:SDR family NAD(P)-dependent oxidoreductase n=1 Tax=Actinomyces sp. B33 TaxID=2942131 RepID=UPI00234066C0|nr:3-oxoacyl-ACP reductase FabG [Actinomyces sp. B33]MDC4232482.1 3-oxoacyl-ACP reductase FabG [Actinomyces sp. B33]